MEAAYYIEPGQVETKQIAEPIISDNELLIKVGASAICGTDMRIFKHGHFKIPAGTSRVLGHEIAGEIVQVGKLLESYQLGMRVSVTPNIGCGHCSMCRDGYNNMCPEYEAFGISLDGGFQEYMRVPQIAITGGNIFPIPDDVSFVEATLTEPLSCCYNALRSVNTGHEDVVLVIGAGPIGAMHVMLNKIAGAKNVIVADIRQDRLDKIKPYGADETINSSENDLQTALMEITNGHGADVIITAVSVPEIQSQSIKLLAIHGRINFFGGLGKNVTVPIDTNLIHYKGLHLVGTTGSTNSDYQKCLNLVAEQRVNLKSLAANSFSLSEINAAFDFAASGEGMKTMIMNQ